MTWIAVAKVDDLGRRPLLIGGVGGIVCKLLSFCLTALALGMLIGKDDYGSSYLPVRTRCSVGSFPVSAFCLLQISWRISFCCCSCSASLCRLLSGKYFYFSFACWHGDFA